MSTTTRWTSADLESLPDDGNRYEIIDGELYMSKQPHFYHQDVCSELHGVLWNWDRTANLGRVVFAPGLIFAEDDDVAPDVVWISNERLIASLRADGKFQNRPSLSSKFCRRARRMSVGIVRRSLTSTLAAVSVSTGL